MFLRRAIYSFLLLTSITLIFPTYLPSATTTKTSGSSASRSHWWWIDTIEDSLTDLGYSLPNSKGGYVEVKLKLEAIFAFISKNKGTATATVNPYSLRETWHTLPISQRRKTFLDYKLRDSDRDGNHLTRTPKGCWSLSVSVKVSAKDMGGGEDKDSAKGCFIGHTFSRSITASRTSYLSPNFPKTKGSAWMMHQDDSGSASGTK